MQRVVGRILLGAGAALTVASLLLGDTLPAPAALRPELKREPVQQPTATAPFEARVGGVTYTLHPVADYEIWGLVVSNHDADAWWDWIHQASNDHLNVVDLCVVFAENVERGSYLGLDYSSGQFVCNVATASSERWQRFSMRALANNHLLADRASLAKRLRGVRVGDQVRIRGLLTEYTHNEGFAFRRGTSVTRDDTGNGACETIYVQEIDVLHRGGQPWRWLLWPALGLLLAGVVVWLRTPFRAD